MHGFLNVFLAAAFARAGWDESRLVPLLEETDRAAFQFSDSGANWRENSISTGELREARARFAMSFGSCSFDEPVADLQMMNLLECAR
jgi:hypothetical protein